VSATPLVEARGMAKTFRRDGADVWALRDIDLAIERGEYVAITGRSGSGKSTLLHVLGALEQASAGTCRFDGRDIASLDDAERSHMRGRRIGFVFQRFHLVPQLDVLENVALPLLYAGETLGAARARASTALDSVGLGHRRTHRPPELSGGELQRAAIARAVVARPELLLADEPTGNLDSTTGCEIIALLEALHADGVTVVLVTHDGELARRAQRTIALRDGHLCD
jgi:putative ABC transport system ATP-binding protein